MKGKTNSKKLFPVICQALGFELEEEFYIKHKEKVLRSYNQKIKCKFTENGFLHFDETVNKWYSAKGLLYIVLSGEVEIFKENNFF